MGPKLKMSFTFTVIHEQKIEGREVHTQLMQVQAYRVTLPFNKGLTHIYTKRMKNASYL